MTNFNFLMLFLLILLSTIIFLYKKFLHKSVSIFDFNLLKEYLINNYKNRNLLKNKAKKTLKTLKITNKSYIVYKKLNKIHVSKKINKSIKYKKKTYVERVNFAQTKTIVKISSILEKSINKNKEKYRSLNNQCLIELVAFSFAHSLVLKDNFNLFDCFKELSSSIRIYKKEAEILSSLIILELTKIYYKMQSDIKKIKADIFNAAKTKIKIIDKNYSSAFIYGLYCLNPQSSSLFFYNKSIITKATTNLINDMDLILIKQRLIFKYIMYLSGSDFYNE